MSAPGFSAAGSFTQARRFSGVLAATPAPSVARLIRCVRSGPNTPLAGVPLTVWQFMHATDVNRSRPARTAGTSAATACCAATQRAKSSGECTVTVRSMPACCRPQKKGQLADGERRRGRRGEHARCRRDPHHRQPETHPAIEVPRKDTARRKLSILRACCEDGAAVYVPSRLFFSKNTQSADRALPRGANQEPVGLSRGSEERPGCAGALRPLGGLGGHLGAPHVIRPRAAPGG